MTPRKSQLLPLLEALVNPELEGAGCAGRAPMFDDDVDGETPEERLARLGVAFSICRDCPVHAACDTAAREHQSVGLWAGRLHEAPEQFKSRKRAS
ncbi:hypothetical protein FXW78_07060 [Rhodococcus opacus]|nr:hypothetical protein [Rhodococcus opacus]